MAGTVLAARTHLAPAYDAGTVTAIEYARGAVPEPPQTDRCSAQFDGWIAALWMFTFGIGSLVTCPPFAGELVVSTRPQAGRV